MVPLTLGLPSFTFLPSLFNTNHNNGNNATFSPPTQNIAENFKQNILFQDVRQRLALHEQMFNLNKAKRDTVGALNYTINNSLLMTGGDER